jgi:hypothetical protein
VRETKGEREREGEREQCLRKKTISTRWNYAEPFSNEPNNTNTIKKAYELNNTNTIIEVTL